MVQKLSYPASSAAEAASMYFRVASQQVALSYLRSIGFGRPAPASGISTPPKKNAPTFMCSPFVVRDSGFAP